VLGQIHGVPVGGNVAALNAGAGAIHSSVVSNSFET
jgi:hypothetical protein